MITKVKQTLNAIFSRSREESSQLLNQDDKNLLHYNRMLGQTVDYVTECLKKCSKPFSGVKPEDLRPVINQIELDKPLDGLPALFRELDQLYTQHAVYFHRPEYLAHLNCPILIPALAAEVVISSINSSLDTWDQSAGGTLIEQKLIRWTCDQLSMGSEADGVFTSGGTQSNMMGLLLARDFYLHTCLNWDIRKAGLPDEAKRFRIFCSGKSHFSLKKSCNILGLGESILVQVPINDAFQMSAYELELAIANEIAAGNIPIAIVATAGTTDFGSIDPLLEIGKIAEKYALWYHVDAAYGCGLMLSDKHNYLLNGIQQANSVTVDYHKAFFQPVSSSALLVKDASYFNLITHHADYLNPKEHEKNGLPNQVNKSIQTTRRFDALKLWFSLRLIGRDQLGVYIDALISLAQQASMLIAEDHELELLNKTEISTILFRYRPFSASLLTLNSLNTFIRKRLYETGLALVASTKVDEAVYLKFTILNPHTTIQDIVYTLNLIKTYGDEYATQN